MRTGKDILFVDDELDSIDSLTDFFRDDYCVLAVDDIHVMDEVNKRTYDYVSIDIDMKRKDGIQVYTELRGIDQRSVVFVLTNLPPSHPKVKWFESQGVPVFSKSGYKTPDKIRAYMNRFRFNEPADLSVLIIDDEKHKQDIYVEVLTDIGFVHIERSNSVEAAQRLIQERTFDIYLVDMYFLEGGNLVLRGPEIISLLHHTDNYSTCVVIPISTLPRAKDSLRKITASQNIRPYFFKEQIPFGEELRKIWQRGPFGVRNV